MVIRGEHSFPMLLLLSTWRAIQEDTLGLYLTHHPVDSLAGALGKSMSLCLCLSLWGAPARPPGESMSSDLPLEWEG